MLKSEVQDNRNGDMTSGDGISSDFSKRLHLTPQSWSKDMWEREWASAVRFHMAYPNNEEIKLVIQRFWDCYSGTKVSDPSQWPIVGLKLWAHLEPKFIGNSTATLPDATTGGSGIRVVSGSHENAQKVFASLKPDNNATDEKVTELAYMTLLAYGLSLRITVKGAVHVDRVLTEKFTQFVGKLLKIDLMVYGKLPLPSLTFLSEFEIGMNKKNTAARAVTATFIGTEVIEGVSSLSKVIAQASYLKAMDMNGLGVLSWLNKGAMALGTEEMDLLQAMVDSQFEQFEGVGLEIINWIKETKGEPHPTWRYCRLLVDSAMCQFATSRHLVFCATLATVAFDGTGVDPFDKIPSLKRAVAKRDIVGRFARDLKLMFGVQRKQVALTQKAEELLRIFNEMEDQEPQSKRFFKTSAPQPAVVDSSPRVDDMTDSDSDN